MHIVGKAEMYKKIKVCLPQSDDATVTVCHFWLFSEMAEAWRPGTNDDLRRWSQHRPPR